MKRIFGFFLLLWTFPACKTEKIVLPEKDYLQQEKTFAAQNNGQVYSGAGYLKRLSDKVVLQLNTADFSADAKTSMLLRLNPADYSAGSQARTLFFICYDRENLESRYEKGWSMPKVVVTSLEHHLIVTDLKTGVVLQYYYNLPGDHALEDKLVSERYNPDHIFQGSKIQYVYRYAVDFQPIKEAEYLDEDLLPKVNQLVSNR